MAEYKPSKFASVPAGLDPASYYELTPERRRLQQERTAIRASLKREYQLQLNNPHRKGLVQDPAVERWVIARSHNIYPNFRATPKFTLLSFLGFGLPLILIYNSMKGDRVKKIQMKKEGKDNVYDLGL